MCASVARAHAQAADTTAPRSLLPAPLSRLPDTARRELKPLPAFFHSLVLPGWAQSKLNRKLTAALFVSWEGVSLGMSLKAAGELRYLRRIGADSARIDGKRREKQDWLVLLAFNHLFSGLEAYVGSHLQDFPSDVKFRPAPHGVGVQAIVPFRLR